MNKRPKIKTKNTYNEDENSGDGNDRGVYGYSNDDKIIDGTR